MMKIIGLLVLACCFGSGLAIKCYACSDCVRGSPSEQMCPSAAPYCGKLEVIANVNGNHAESVSKGCFPERNGRSCEQFMEETMRSSGLFTEQMLQFTKQALSTPGVDIKCGFCRDKDFCNSSSVVLPSLLTFLVLAVLAKLF